MAIVRGDHDVKRDPPGARARSLRGCSAREADVRKRRRDVRLRGDGGWKGKLPLVDFARRRGRQRGSPARKRRTTTSRGCVKRGRRLLKGWSSTSASPRPATCAPTAQGRKLQSYRGHRGAGHISSSARKTPKRCAALASTKKQEQKKPIVMGCYGIGVSRIVATAIEQHNEPRDPRADEPRARRTTCTPPSGPRARTAAGGEAAQKALRRALGARGRARLGRFATSGRGEVQGRGSHRHPIASHHRRARARGGKYRAEETAHRADPQEVELVPVADAARVIAEAREEALL